MLESLRRSYERFFGIGAASVAVPVFDGPLKPNNLLESAPVFLERQDLEDIAVGADGELYAACSDGILRVDRDAGTHPVKAFGSPVQAIAAFEGGLVAATRGGLSFVGGTLDGKELSVAGGRPLQCVNALHAGPDRTLLISDGSRETRHDEWSRDLLERHRSGRVLRYRAQDAEPTTLHDGLAYSFGVCADDSHVLVSESWAHRVAGSSGGKLEAVLDELPGYPSRMSPATGGGFWLTVFAARTQLVEFVLREDEFRRQMLRTIEPKYWIAPSLRAGSDFREPLQQGEVRQMGVLKPWAPPRSYGLVIRLDAQLRPVLSLHSRPGGRHHGITAAVEQGDALIILSKGAGRLLKVDLPGLTRSAA